MSSRIPHYCQTSSPVISHEVPTSSPVMPHEFALLHTNSPVIPPTNSLFNSVQIPRKSLRIPRKFLTSSPLVPIEFPADSHTTSRLIPYDFLTNFNGSPQEFPRNVAIIIGTSRWNHREKVLKPGRNLQKTHLILLKCSLIFPSILGPFWLHFDPILTPF